MDIDIVVPWVDGSDPEWQKEKAKYMPVEVNDSNSPNRFRDWGLMPYWFRAVEKFAPWARTIHFITWGHLPPFLNTEHPKLHIVRHEDYIPAEWLPTFNANTLEMNMHRIPDLAEHFVYFNDDMFLTRPLAEDYFFKNNLPRTHIAEIPVGFVGETEVWQFLAANDMGIINKHFDKKTQEKRYRRKYINLQYIWYDNLRTFAMGKLFPGYYTGFKNFHCPAAYCRSTFETLWEKEPRLLERTSSHKFRDREDVNQWLALWWQAASGEFEPRRINSRTYGVTDGNISEICEDIKTQKYEMICLNDPEGDVNFEALAPRLRDAFEAILPEKSSFER